MIKKKLKTNINSNAILKFPELDDKFDEFENRIQANTTSLSGLSEEVDGIQENVEQNEQELHNLNTNAALKNQENTFTTTNTFNGVINVPNPTSDNNATNKQYVDNLGTSIQQDISTNYLTKQDASTTYATQEQLTPIDVPRNNLTKINTLYNPQGYETYYYWIDAYRPSINTDARLARNPSGKTIRYLRNVILGRKRTSGNLMFYTSWDPKKYEIFTKTDGVYVNLKTDEGWENEIFVAFEAIAN